VQTRTTLLFSNQSAAARGGRGNKSVKEGDLSWLIEALPAGVWVGSVPDGNVTFTNATFERIMGTLPVPEADITAAPQVYGIFDRTGRPYPIELLPFSQVVATKSAVEIDDIVIHRPDGQKIPVRAFGQPSFDAQGNLSQVVIAFFDISREVHAEQQRQETEARLRFAVNNAPIVVWTADTQGTILLSEGAGLSALGMKSG